MTLSVRRSVFRLVGRLVGWSVMLSSKGREFTLPFSSRITCLQCKVIQHTQKLTNEQEEVPAVAPRQSVPAARALQNGGGQRGPLPHRRPRDTYARGHRPPHQTVHTKGR